MEKRADQTRRRCRQRKPTRTERLAAMRRELENELDRAHTAIDRAADAKNRETYITWDVESYRPLARRVARVLRREGYAAHVAREFSEDMGLVLSISW